MKLHKEGNPQHDLKKFMENEDFVGFPSIAIDKIKKEEYIKNNCLKKDIETGELVFTDFGKELWNHVTQWYYELRNY